MLVYLHVPFCARRCSYCDFAIAVRRETPSDAYADAVLAEWRLRQGHPGWAESPSVRSLYLGGGTPSRLAPEALERILVGLRGDRPLAPDAEVTLEANPDDVTPDRVDRWVAAGINRVSLGVQSFAPAVLAWMHRTHTTGQIGAAVRALRSGGVGNLSLDLIYGLPPSLDRRWLDDLDRAFALEPEHLSLYALTVEPRTPLGRWTVRGEVVPASDDRAADEYLEAHERLVTGGFEHYEVSNAARPGFRARHNAGYWRREDFLGLGPSAHGAAGRVRSWNLREWEAYRRAVASGTDPEAGREVLTDAQLLLEARYLGLRTDDGVPSALVPPSHRARWGAQGWAREAEGRLRLTASGWLRLDALVASLPEDSLDFSECLPSSR